MDELRSVGQVVADHRRVLESLGITEVYDATPDVLELLRLEDAEERAKVTRASWVSDFGRRLNDAVKTAKWFETTAKRYYETHQLERLIQTIPVLGKSATYDAKVRHLEATEGYSEEHPEVDADLTSYRAMVQAVLDVREAVTDARLAEKAAAQALREAERLAVARANGWLKVLRGIAEIRDDRALLKSLPKTLRLRGHRRAKAAGVPPTPPGPAANPV